MEGITFNTMDIHRMIVKNRIEEGLDFEITHNDLVEKAKKIFSEEIEPIRMEEVIKTKANGEEVVTFELDEFDVRFLIIDEPVEVQKEIERWMYDIIDEEYLKEEFKKAPFYFIRFKDKLLNLTYEEQVEWRRFEWAKEFWKVLGVETYDLVFGDTNIIVIESFVDFLAVTKYIAEAERGFNKVIKKCPHNISKLALAKAIARHCEY